MSMCESGWTGDRCTARLDHGGPHTNDSRDVIVSWLEQQPACESPLAAINQGYPAGEVLADYHSTHTVRGELIPPDGVPYGTTHDPDCPGCAGRPYGTSPRDEAYWAS